MKNQAWKGQKSGKNVKHVAPVHFVEVRNASCVLVVFFQRFVSPTSTHRPTETLPHFRSRPVTSRDDVISVVIIVDIVFGERASQQAWIGSDEEGVDVISCKFSCCGWLSGWDSNGVLKGTYTTLGNNIRKQANRK